MLRRVVVTLQQHMNHIPDACDMVRSFVLDCGLGHTRPEHRKSLSPQLGLAQTLSTARPANPDTLYDLP